MHRYQEFKSVFYLCYDLVKVQIQEPSFLINYGPTDNYFVSVKLLLDVAEPLNNLSYLAENVTFVEIYAEKHFEFTEKSGLIC